MRPSLKTEDGFPWYAEQKSGFKLINKVCILQSPELSTDKICCFQQQTAFIVYEIWTGREK